MIRPAKLFDAQAIVDLAVESVSRNPLPLRVDQGAMRVMAKSMIGNPSHFVWVNETDGVVDACVAAQVGEGFWFRGLQASVVLYYARPPGSVALLMRRFMRWVESRPGIKMAVVEFEPETDQRLVKFLAGIGMSRVSANATYVRAA